MEANSARVLLAYNSEQKRPVAGLTKIATAKVVLDWTKISQTKLTTMMFVPGSITQLPGSNPMGLQPGEQISIRDALYSSLLGSDDAASYTLACHVGQALLIQRQRQGEPEKTFVKEMNFLAKSLGMRKTKFTSSHGSDITHKKGRSTASDIARLCVYAMRETSFVFYVKQPSRKVTVSAVSGARRTFTVKNTNTLLGEMQINGVKTGQSAVAGPCLAINSHRTPLVTKLSDGRSQIRRRDLVVVVLGSSDRFAQGKQLAGQGWAAFKQWGDSGYPISENKREYLIVPQIR